MTAVRPRVVVTRTFGDVLAANLVAIGFDVALVPLIETVPMVRLETITAAVRAAEGGWVVVSSAFAARLVVMASDGRAGGAGFAAVGEATAAVLRDGLDGAEVVVSDGPADSESLARTLAPRVSGRPVLVITAEAGRRTLAPALQMAGGEVTELVAYRTTLPAGAPDAFRTALEPAPDALVLASASAARNAAAIVDPTSTPVPLVLCIGAQTAAAARDAGWANVEVAAQASSEAIVTALRSRLLDRQPLR